MDGLEGGWIGGKASLRIAYSMTLKAPTGLEFTASK